MRSFALLPLRFWRSLVPFCIFLRPTLCRTTARGVYTQFCTSSHELLPASLSHKVRPAEIVQENLLRKALFLEVDVFGRLW